MSYLKPLATKVVTKHINIWDPMQLIEMGAPPDEYEEEVEKVVNTILENEDEIQLAESIVESFKYTFGRELDFNKTLIIAKNIWKELYE
ncbi:DUF1871 family protein [Alkalibacillus haloalkaliphilus]|uniref:DUF1871 domain-containing protein n=1 Tax=Alkalibacillus haloalkaliphilus TaxID=94136 RepID=A0A511W6R6_9BACI|nr:DUF1871 family protein [Alkalibacillus haloalkaliphilus]GEN46736.1 hypothetical protein AHA02nite_25120 [Alkalibacillus haloalkaliphilus]